LPKTSAHSSGARLLVRMIDFRSYRSRMISYRSCAPRVDRGTRPKSSRMSTPAWRQTGPLGGCWCTPCGLPVPGRQTGMSRQHDRRRGCQPDDAAAGRGPNILPAWRQTGLDRLIRHPLRKVGLPPVPVGPTRSTLSPFSTNRQEPSSFTSVLIDPALVVECRLELRFTPTSSSIIGIQGTTV